MSLPFSNKTQDQVEAANIRAALNNGKEWGTSGSTLATVSDLAAIATPGSATAADVAAKVNTILALLRNLNA
jgi:hypothetical protein